MAGSATADTAKSSESKIAQSENHEHEKLQPDYARIIARAESWIRDNPATMDDGGLTDIIDEAVSLYVRRNLTRDNKERESIRAMLREHMARLEKLPAFREWSGKQHWRLIDVYHLVLALYLARRSGSPYTEEQAIIKRARQSLLMTPYCGATVRLTVATLLDYLGTEPVMDLDRLREVGGIAQLGWVSKRGSLPSTNDAATIKAASFHLYAIVHEVIVLADFGARAIPSWLYERKDVVAGELRKGVDWAVERKQWDLLAEMIVTLKILGVPMDDALRTAGVTLAKAQLPDGTWGESSMSARANKVRHAVLTASQAMRILADTNQ